MSCRHSRAVQAAVKAGGGVLTDVHQPLIILCEELAAQMDAADGESSTRLSAAYLSALKDLGRALANVRPQEAPDALAALKAKRGKTARQGLG